SGHQGGVGEDADGEESLRVDQQVREGSQRLAPDLRGRLSRASSGHLKLGGPRHGPPNPPAFGAPRRSRGAPLKPWRPSKAVAPVYWLTTPSTGRREPGRSAGILF